jgi:spore germination protein
LVKSGVTDRQVFFLIFLTLTAYMSISVPNVIAKHVGISGWITLIVTAILFAAFAAVIVRLNSRFPGLTLFEYGQQIVGKALTYLLVAYFIGYFLMYAVYMNIQLASFLKAEFYPKTPERAMLAVSIAVFGFVSYRGVTNVARFFEIIGVAFLIATAATHMTMIQQGNIREIQPFFRASKFVYDLLAVRYGALFFIGIEVLLIIPLSGIGARRTTWVAAIAVLFVGFAYVVIVETSIMVLGLKAAANYNYAMIEAIKLIDIPIFERFDLIYLTVGFYGLVAGICGLYLALVEYAARVFWKVHRLVVVSAIGVILFALSVAALNMKNAKEILQAALPVAGVVSGVIIPTVLILIAKVRRLGEKPR